MVSSALVDRVGEPLPPGGAPVAGDDDRRVCVWFANDLLARPRARSPRRPAGSCSGRGRVGAAAGIQIFWGALVAGLKAGLSRHVPADGWRTAPAECLVEDPCPSTCHNMATVQWVHRVLATVLLVGAVAFVVKVRRAPALAPSGGGARPSLA